MDILDLFIFFFFGAVLLKWLKRGYLKYSKKKEDKTIKNINQILHGDRRKNGKAKPGELH